MNKCQFPGCIKELPEGVNHCVPHGKHFGEPKQEKKKVYAIPKVSAKKKANQPEEKVYKQQLSEFFDRMLNESQHTCQECGCDLYSSTILNERAIICHILPKKTFTVVAMNPDNIVNLCNVHHHMLDLGGSKKVMAMNIYPLLKERVKILLPLIPEDQLKSIPEYLL